MRSVVTRLLSSFAILLSITALLARPAPALSQPVLAAAEAWGANDAVTAAAVQPDGKIIIGGKFTQVSGREHLHLARFNADGSLDDSFQASANDYPRGFTILPDGKILVYGDFTQLNGQPRSIGRLNPDGTLDTTFDPHTTSPTWDTVVQKDGKYVLAGHFFIINDQDRGRMIRLNADGSLDPDFHPDGASPVFNGPAAGYIYHLALQPDGMILAGGDMTQLDGQPVNSLIRVKPDGSLDAAFLPDMYQGATAMILLPDGKILVGKYDSATGKNALIRLNADGSQDLTFTAAAQYNAAYLALEADGGIVVSGGVDRTLYRLDAAGQPRANVSPLVNNSIYTLLVVKDKILIGGWFTQVNGHSRNYLALLNPDGTLDGAFAPQDDPLDWGATDTVSASAVQPDGKIVIGGDFVRVGGRAHRGLARLAPDGTVDESFKASANGWMRSILALPDGKLLVMGDFTELNGQPRPYMGRLNPDGTLDTTFHPLVAGTGGGNVSDAVLQADGRYVIAGRFTSVNGEARASLARLSADGTLDPDFHPDVQGLVQRLALQPDGKILLCGAMWSIDAQPAFSIARILPDGQVDTTFVTDIQYQVSDIVVQPDGKILAGGQGVWLNNAYQNTLVRLNADGSRDNTFLPPTGSWVYQIALEPDGKVIKAGAYNNNLARLTSDGTVMPAFTPTINNSVYTMQLIGDKILLGGVFTTVNGQPRNHLALLNLDGSLVEGFNPGPEFHFYLPALLRNH